MLQQEFLQPRRAWFMVSSLIAFAIIAAFSVFFEIKETRLERKIHVLKTQQETLRNTSVVDGAQGEVLANVLGVKSSLKHIEENQLLWSKLIEKIENTVPRLGESNEKVVEFRSYNGSEEGKISVSATTRAGAPEPFTDVALAIRAFASDLAFKNVFVPSITKNITPQGDTVLSFSMNFEYQKQNF